MQPTVTSLRQRARPPSEPELAGIPWLTVLAADDRREATAALVVVSAEPGDRVCRTGAPSTYWFGVIDGLLKMSNVSLDGTPITYTGIPPGAWFGEGTLLKREIYRYNIEALRKSTVAGLPLAVFWTLLERSIPFNRFVMTQLNERLGQFIAAREIDRNNQPDARVARSLAALFHPVLYPGVGQVLRITQQELAWLVGLSRQRVNEALTALAGAGLIRVEYGGVRVLDLGGLRCYQLV
jgi:CRP-like cAMP-binding protein